MFHGEAKRFYLDHVDCDPTYEDAKAQLISRYCSKSCQVRTQQILEALWLRKACKEDYCSQEKGLNHIKKKVDDLANLTPEYCRTERARCTFFHKAVVSEDWATAELSKALTSECTFEEMYQAIQVALQIHTEAIQVS
jgi:hypothetical protein